MSLDEAVSALTAEIAQLDYVVAFQKAENALKSCPEVWDYYEAMKRAQKKAVLFRQIEKLEAAKQAAQEAAQLEKDLKNEPLVANYAIKMADVNDLLQHLTDEISRQINENLEENA